MEELLVHNLELHCLYRISCHFIYTSLRVYTCGNVGVVISVRIHNPTMITIAKENFDYRYCAEDNDSWTIVTITQLYWLYLLSRCTHPSTLECRIQN